MPEENAKPYEAKVTVEIVELDGTKHEAHGVAHGEVHCADPAETVARGILETLQDRRGKDHVRIIDPNA